jgi:hypothetical protein
MYYVISKMRGRRGGKRTSAMGCHAMPTADRKLVDQHAAFVASKAGMDAEVMVLTAKQAAELHANLGRKLLSYDGWRTK